MRNWNWYYGLCCYTAVSVFSLPMRNWNSLWPGRWILYRQGFQPTYEELKHGDFREEDFPPLRFQPTYEELKRLPAGGLAPSSHTFSAYLWGIETRFRAATPEGSPAPFSAYLWGIETFKNHIYSHHLYSFQPTYEELKLLFMVLSYPILKSFQPTYEELKLLYRRW